MAPLLLLTPEQAQRNKELFERAPASSHPSPRHEPLFLPVSKSDDTAGTLAVANGTIKSGYPPPPNSTIFSDPKYHENVISTFIGTAMTTVGYTPNSPTSTPQEEAIGFNSFLQELTRYGAYLSLEKSSRDKYEHTSSDCTPLLNTIKGFIEGVESLMGATNALEVASQLTDMITNAVKNMGSSSSETVQKTLYSVYRINGDVVGKPYPVANIFWSSVNMEKHTGSKTTVEKQTVDLISYSYMILSDIVVANAEALGAAAPISVTDLVEAVNKNVPSE